MKKIFSPKQKASVALEALRGTKKINQIASEHSVHPNVVGQWKKILADNLETIFSDKRKKDNKEKDDLIEELYKIIGQREAELAWLKKNCSLTHKERVSLIDADSELSLSKQAELLDISRASLYLKPMIGEEDVRTMNLIDKICTETPFYGSRRIKRDLEDRNVHICRDHVRRLMRIMGLEAIYPKKCLNISLSDQSHKKYPYLLSGVAASCPNHIWGTDITYVKMEESLAYINAVIDWFSRYVVS